MARGRVWYLHSCSPANPLTSSSCISITCAVVRHGDRNDATSGERLTYDRLASACGASNQPAPPDQLPATLNPNPNLATSTGTPCEPFKPFEGCDVMRVSRLCAWPHLQAAGVHVVQRHAHPPS
jgi:hypothetical protein